MEKLCCGSITLCSDKGDQLATVYVYHGQEKKALTVVNRIGRLLANQNKESYSDITLDRMLEHVDESVDVKSANKKILRFGKKNVDVEGQLLLF